MLKLTARTRVSELKNCPPAVLETLKSTGIWRDDEDPELMLGQLCWSQGFNPGILLMMLEAVNVPEEVPPLDIDPFLDMPLTELVEHIEKVHHVYLREALPRLTAMAADAAVRPGADLQLAELSEEMARLATELDAHLLHEEEALFPMVRNLGAGAPVAPTRCGDSVGGPISCMENEHDMAARTLRRMRELTADYAAAESADGEYRAFMAALADFDRDMREHMYKENKALFPRALEAQRGGRAAASA